MTKGKYQRFLQVLQRVRRNHRHRRHYHLQAETGPGGEGRETRGLPRRGGSSGGALPPRGEGTGDPRRVEEVALAGRGRKGAVEEEAQLRAHTDMKNVSVLGTYLGTTGLFPPRFYKSGLSVFSRSPLCAQARQAGAEGDNGGSSVGIGIGDDNGGRQAGEGQVRLLLHPGPFLLIPR